VKEKRKLVLYASGIENAANVAIAATLARMCRSRGILFDTYYHSYHQGTHFPGGDCRLRTTGEMTGGTVSGDHHLEQLYLLLLNFDVTAVCWGETFLDPYIRRLGVPVLCRSKRIGDIYREVAKHLGVGRPDEIVMVGTFPDSDLKGLENYSYPEIIYRDVSGVPDRMAREDLEGICGEGGKILCFYVSEEELERLRAAGFAVGIGDSVRDGDDYGSITKRIASRWYDRARGWMIGDPVLVGHWIPTACEEDIVSVYATPQERIVSELSEEIRAKSPVVYGRQYSDRDFLELSKRDTCLQVIDPCRPAFQALKHAEYVPEPAGGPAEVYAPEYTDEELEQFAQEGRILVSLMFWGGMIRETQALHNLMDLIAIARLKCGLVVTAQTYEYGISSPFELVNVPVEWGGVHPLVEPVLGSCGIGVGMESYMTSERLSDDLREALARIERKVGRREFAPRGWWPTMDTELKEVSWWKKARRVQWMSRSPYLQVRFHGKDEVVANETESRAGRSFVRSARDGIRNGVEKAVVSAGLRKYFSAYRPYELYEPGELKHDIVDAAKRAGLKYMFTKAEFKAEPRVLYSDDDIIVLNYTTGRWDGWTPFETINHLCDLAETEKRMTRAGRPGWIVGTIDTCLWTFSGEVWKRGPGLHDIARFCSEGGRTGKLVNVRPGTVVRYARVIAHAEARKACGKGLRPC
jgi:hypothetical protein